MGAHAELRRSETGTGDFISRRAEAAEIVLVWRHVTAIGKVARFLQGLAEGHVGPDAFAAGFVIIGLDDLFQRRIQLRMGIALADEMDHLAGRDRRRTHNRIGTGRDVEHGPAIGLSQLPIGLFHGFLIDDGVSCSSHAGQWQEGRSPAKKADHQDGCDEAPPLFIRHDKSLASVFLRSCGKYKSRGPGDSLCVR